MGLPYDAERVVQLRNMLREARKRILEGETGAETAMTALTMRMIKGDFVVTGPDVEPMKFKSRREARDWCMTHHPGSPITEVGPGKRKPPARETGRQPRGTLALARHY